jgi:hypothetical protein
VRTALLAAVGSGCAMTSDLGVISHDAIHDLGGSVALRGGIGVVNRYTAMIDTEIRGDVASDNTRLAFGTGVDGGVPIGTARLLARVGIWGAVASSTREDSIVPSFELAGYIPDHESSDTDSKYGWQSGGIVFGVREDLDVVPYTTVFVGYQLYLIPGY